MANIYQSDQEKPELVRISELAENLVLYLPGCADVMIRKAIQEVYREFCRETKCLTAEHLIPLQDGECRYPVVPMFSGVVIEVREVRIGRIELRSDIDYRVFDGHPLCVHIAPRYVESEPEPPAQEEHIERGDRRKLYVKAVEVPSMMSEKSPRWFIEKHGEAIVAGVLSRLCAMQGRPWYDAALASDNRIRYENAKSEERMHHELLPGGGIADLRDVL